MQQRIIRNARKKRDAVSGFTLIEALVSDCLDGRDTCSACINHVAMAADWNRGIARAQRSELVSVAVERLIADIGASEFIPLNGDAKAPLFDGTEFLSPLYGRQSGPIPVLASKSYAYRKTMTKADKF